MNSQMMAVPTTAAPRALTEREVSERLGLTVACLRAWRHRGQGPRFLRLGRAVRYLPADLEDFLRLSAVDVRTDSTSDRSLDSEEPLP
jgi:predicted DNA-binding transcriptional regulator AlpA